MKSILSKEKYEGDALLQKRFTVDSLTKATKINEGEVPQYYVQNRHPAIIAPDEFDAVQAEIERRKSLGRPCGCNSSFSAKLVCGDCGGFYGSKVWGSNTKYRRIIWRCNEKYNGDKKCKTLHLTKDDVKERFLIAINKLMYGREELIANCCLAQSILCDCSKIDTEIEELRQEIEVVTELSKKAIYENAHVAISKDEWSERNNSYLERHRKATERVDELEKLRCERQNKALRLDTYIKGIEACPLILEQFDDKVWTVAIAKVKVMPDGSLIFNFKDGTEIEA